MKVIQINVVYKQGSTGYIAYNIHNFLSKSKVSSKVIYSRSSLPSNSSEFRVCGKWYSRVNALLSRISGYPFKYCFLSTKKVIKYIKKTQPDIVHLHCLNGSFLNVYKLLNFLKENRIKTVLTLHAEFMYTGGCGHSLGCDKWVNGSCGNCIIYKQQTKSLFFDRSKQNFDLMFESFRNFENLYIIGVSEWISKRAKRSFILSKFPIATINNGIDTNVFNLINKEKIQAIKKRLGIQCGKKVILCVNSRFQDKIKGGDLFLELVKKFNNDYIFVCVGLKEKLFVKNLITINYINSQKELNELYCCADVLAFTSRIENYPTVCLEANCCGLPVVGFDNGGIKESIWNGMGEAVECYNLEKFAKCIEKWANVKIKSSVIEECRKERGIYNMQKKYLKLYESVGKKI